MTVYTSVHDLGLYSPEHPGERREFTDRATATAWFVDYVNDEVYTYNGYDHDVPGGGSACAVMDIYDDQHAEEPIARLQAAENPDSSRRVFDHSDGDPIMAGVKASGVHVFSAVEGYRDAMLNLQADHNAPDCACSTSVTGGRPHITPLARRGGVVTGEVMAMIEYVVSYAIGKHPIAARRYLAKVAEQFGEPLPNPLAAARALGWDMYAEQAEQGCGFWGSTGDRELDSYMARLVLGLPHIHLEDRMGVLHIGLISTSHGATVRRG